MWEAAYRGSGQQLTAVWQRASYRELRLRISLSQERVMHSIVYIVGAVVIVLAILSFVGLG